MVSFLARGDFFNYPKLDAIFLAICEDDSSGSPGMDMFAAWVSWPWICLATLDFFPKEAAKGSFKKSVAMKDRH